MNRRAVLIALASAAVATVVWLGVVLAPRYLPKAPAVEAPASPRRGLRKDSIIRFQKAVEAYEASRAASSASQPPAE